MKEQDKPEQNKNETELSKEKVGRKPLNLKIFNSMSSENLKAFVDNLYNPNFLGSVHLKRETEQATTDTSTNLSQKILKDQLNVKIEDGIKNSLFNPLTKILIIALIFFNLVYLLFLFI